MRVRKPVYLDAAESARLEDASRCTGRSVSELIRRAIQDQYPARHQLSWDEVFAHSVQAGSAVSDPWVYDPLWDAEFVDAIEEKLTGRRA